MRLYLSSYRLGKHPQRLVGLVGKGRSAAVINNARDANTPDVRAQGLMREFEDLSSLGFDCTEIDLRTFFNTSITVADLTPYDLIWVRGGNVFNLRRAMRQSGFDSVITELLHNDAIVYGGYSAGGCVLAPSFEGYTIVDDPYDVPEGYDSEVPMEGLGLLPYAIEPHYKSDHPESRDIDKEVDFMEEHGIPYKTLKDGEVLVVDGDREEILL